MADEHDQHGMHPPPPSLPPPPRRASVGRHGTRRCRGRHGCRSPAPCRRCRRSSSAHCCRRRSRSDGGPSRSSGPAPWWRPVPSRSPRWRAATKAEPVRPRARSNSSSTSLNHEDVLGAMDVLLPGERRTFRQPMTDIMAELRRLEIVAKDADLGHVGGTDLEITIDDTRGGRGGRRHRQRDRLRRRLALGDRQANCRSATCSSTRCSAAIDPTGRTDEDAGSGTAPTTRSR